MTIHIEQLRFNAIIGVLEFERQTPQPVEINLIAKYNYTKDSFIDYANVANLIKDTIIQGKFTLIEDALIALENEIKSKYKDIETLEIKISKPEILENCRVSVSKKWSYN